MPLFVKDQIKSTLHTRSILIYVLVFGWERAHGTTSGGVKGY